MITQRSPDPAQQLESMVFNHARQQVTSCVDEEESTANSELRPTLNPASRRMARQLLTHLTEMQLEFAKAKLSHWQQIGIDFSQVSKKQGSKGKAHKASYRTML
eukprot:Clim_evm27s22 gene=Clim_evmTU27s22